MKEKKKFSKKQFVYSTVIIMAILFLSIGFAAFNTELRIGDIGLTVRVKKDIRINSISVDSDHTSNATSNYEDYNVHNINVGFNLPSNDSEITYKVTVTNIGNTEMGILNISGVPDNISYEILNYNIGDPICDDSKCSLGAQKDIYIKFKYKNGVNSTGETTYNFIADVDFRPFYNVTYGPGFLNASNYPKTALEGSTLNVNLGAETQNLVTQMGGVPLTQGTDYTLNNFNLTVPDVSGDINVTADVRVMNDSMNNEGSDRWISAGGMTFEGASGLRGVYIIDGNQNSIFSSYPYYVRLSGADVHWYDSEANFKNDKKNDILSAPANVKFVLETLSGSCTQVDDGSLQVALYDNDGNIIEPLKIFFTDFDFNTPNTIATASGTINTDIRMVGLVVKKSGSFMNRMNCKKFTFSLKIYTY